jgi:leucyl aminopeptidase
LIEQFDRKLVAQQYINLALGKPNSGVYSEAVVGSRKLDQKAITQGDKIWEEHFEKPVVNTLESFFD